MPLSIDFHIQILGPKAPSFYFMVCNLNQRARAFICFSKTNGTQAIKVEFFTTQLRAIYQINNSKTFAFIR